MRKPAAPREIPPPLELACLKVLWTLGEGNVRQVQQSLAATRNLAYTTVMTIMDRLTRKGAVERRKLGRSFVYVPVLSRETLRRLAVRELVDSLFDGAEEDLIAYLRGAGPERSTAAPRPAASDIDAALL